MFIFIILICDSICFSKLMSLSLLLLYVVVVAIVVIVVVAAATYPYQSLLNCAPDHVLSLEQQFLLQFFENATTFLSGQKAMTNGQHSAYL